MNIKRYIDMSVRKAVRRVFADNAIDVGTAARRAKEETKRSEFWPSDFLHNVSGAIYREGKSRSDKELLAASARLTAIAHKCARINTSGADLKSNFSKTLSIVNSFDIRGYEQLTSSIRRLYKTLCNKALSAN